MQTTVSPVEILILAPGESPGEQSNAKGHLFEQFIANLMALFGYEHPKQSNINVTSNGIELDIACRHVPTNKRMIAECKAYTSPLSAKELQAFYGKVHSERFDTPDLFGYFIAIPGLTKDGRELQRKLERNDRNFRVYEAELIIELLLERKQISEFAAVAATHHSSVALLSGHALLVTPDGLFYAAHEVAADTRLPLRVLIFPAKPHERVPGARCRSAEPCNCLYQRRALRSCRIGWRSARVKAYIFPRHGHRGNG